ncbi:hypothetical protein IWQ61_010669, partial [Dispira simplex]
PVHPNPRPALLDLYKRTLSELETKIPQYAVYRQATEAITKHRMNIVEKTEDVTEIEKIVGAGQIEELINAAETELRLIPYLAEVKPWEPLEEPAPEGQWTYFKNQTSTS